MLRLVAPAGAPVKSAELLRGLGRAVFQERSARHTDTLAAQLRVSHIFGMSSGRAALWLILKTLKGLRPDRDVVAIPAYTCFSVAASVVRCGMKIHPIEVNPETLDFDITSLDSLPAERLLCLVTGNLFGLVNDCEQLKKAVRARGAFLVDDAAQAMGSTRNGRFAGTLGDVGFYSLAGGKASGSVQGGLIVTNSDSIARKICKEAQYVGTTPVADKIRLLLKTAGYATFLHPRLFWIPSSLPFLKLGRTEFEPGFPVAQFPRLSGALLPELIGTMGGANGTRRSNAAAIADALAGLPQFAIPQPAADCQPGYIRFPVLAKNAVIRQKAVRRLREVGIGASPFYPSAICDIPGIDQYMALREFHRPRAEQISERLFTLPTHAYVRPREIERMATVLREIQE